MKITFIGAAREVTGSCTYVEAAGKRFLVDYGMEQGKRSFETMPLPVPPDRIDFVLLTHAHIDHSGMLPLLFKNGFRGAVHTTVTTRNLAGIMLMDCAHIQEADAETKTRKNMRAGKPPVEPLYDSDDTEGVFNRFVSHMYGEKTVLSEGIEVRFTDAGHLLGSASIELWLTEDGVTKKIVFSGDVGNIDQPLIRDPEFIREADYAVLESTYGTREHETPPDFAVALADVLQRTFDRGGNVVVPAFAVGRTQEMLYFIRRIKEEGLVHGHDGFPVYVDSPLALSATRIFIDNAEYCYDAEARALLDAGVNPIGFDGLKTAESSEESVAINTDTTPKVILSASGMCEAGRIRHHLKHNLWRPECTILFVGYQSVGTTGRLIADGAEEITLFGEKIAIHAEVVTLPGISGHGDKNELRRWAEAIEPKPLQIFVNHGDNESALALAKTLKEECGIPAMAPASGTEFDLGANCLIRLTDPIPAVIRISKETFERAESLVSARQEKSENAYLRLQKAFERLTAVVEAFEFESDQNIAALRNGIYSLLDKFETGRTKRAAERQRLKAEKHEKKTAGRNGRNKKKRR